MRIRLSRLKEQARVLRRRERGVAIVLVMFFILLILGMTVAGGMLTRQNFTNFRSHDREVKARYASHAALQTGLHHLSNDSTWAPTESNPHVEYLDAPTNSVGFKVWLEGVNRNSTVPVVTPSGQTLTKGQAIMRVTALVDGQSEGGYLGGADSLRLEQPTVPYEVSLFQGGRDGGGGVSQYLNLLSYSSNPLAPIPPVEFSWDPRNTYRADWWMTSYGTDSQNQTVPVQNRRGGFREAYDASAFRASHEAIRILGTYRPTTEAANITYFFNMSSVPPRGSWNIDDQPWVPIRFDYPQRMRGLAGADFTGGGELTPGFYSRVTVPAGQTLVLERGASYGIKSLWLDDGANIVLAGASTEPCLVYFESFGINSPTPMTVGSRVNMPASGAVPVPWDLHFLGVGASSSTDLYSCKVAAVVITEAFCSWNSDCYGTVITGTRSANWNIRSNLHFDEAIRGREAPVEPNWILTSQARNG